MLLASEYEQYMLVNLGYIVNRFSQWPYVYIGWLVNYTTSSSVDTVGGVA